MQTQLSRRSSLFFLELLFAIFYFILAAALCVQFFVKSHTLEAESIELNHAVNSATSVAELLHGDDGSLSLLKNECPLAEETEEGFYIFYDKEWVPCEGSEAVYTLSLTITSQNNFLYGHIDVCNAENSIYSLDVEYYQPEGGIF